jgi:hypothetical protein
MPIETFETFREKCGCGPISWEGARSGWDKALAGLPECGVHSA